MRLIFTIVTYIGMFIATFSQGDTTVPLKPATVAIFCMSGLSALLAIAWRPDGKNGK